MMPAMQVISAPQPARPSASVLGGTLFGGTSVAVGVAFAYLIFQTPLMSQVAPPMRGASAAGIVVGIWSFSIVAGGALVVAGTDQLASVLAGIRSGRRLVTPVMRVLHDLPADIVLAIGVTPDRGLPIPELVIGQFGAAVVHADGVHETHHERSEAFEAGGVPTWRPWDDPVTRVTKDADRVRRWLAGADLDFVVRVHAAFVTTDTSIERTATCAVIAETQIPAWLAALPGQRSLTAGRRSRIVAMVREAVDHGGPPETRRRTEGIRH
jgi:hypothetical protein